MNFLDMVKQHPGGVDAPAITFGDGPAISYGELLQRADDVAQWLRAAGVQPGDRIALVAKNGPWFFELLLACCAIGAALVPINTRLSPSEIGGILDDCAPSRIVADSAGMAGVPGRFGSLDAAESLGRAPEAQGAAAASPQRAEATAVLLQMYTSGTTGKPKGVMLTHANIASIAQTGARALGAFNPEDRALVCLPLFHIAGVDWALFSLISGAHIFLHGEVQAAAIVDAMVQHRITKTLLVPAVIRMVTEEMERRCVHVESLGALCFGASAMPEELIARARAAFPRARMYHVYGMTESTGMFTALDPAEIEAGRRLLSCGKAFDTGEIRVVDERGKAVAAGAVGHIVYRGPQCMLGYWGNTQATASTVLDGWLQTGDLGSLDEEGFLYVRDRIKDVIDTGGEKVSPAEVENVLAAHPAIADVAVIGCPDPRWGEAVTAVVVRRQGEHLLLEQLRAFARDRLAGFKLPQRLVFMAQLPRNASGKVLKHVLRDQLGSGLE
ncbi:AMP-binding protein [Ramlibacter sp.]|uniref:class I adenylate-forming enzyme family protein n=1 Tax=Ramlibacter sp. TaxID=1917967 RepID=UPI0017FA5B06|nr:AMP-binding protein [Ramlibacter sp.]MBA2673603.1 AMP-binding protein [Ramlibacter sp.]